MDIYQLFHLHLLRIHVLFSSVLVKPAICAKAKSKGGPDGLPPIFINPHMLKVILIMFVLKGGVKLSPRDISASRLARNKIPTVTPMV